MRLACLLLILLSSHSAFALSGYLTAGLGAGGSRLIDFTAYNSQMGAGSSLYITGGLHLAISDTLPHRFEAEIGLGYMTQGDNKKEPHITWSRIPIEAIYFYRNVQEDFRLGWGVTFHSHNELSSTGIGALPTIQVKDSWGWILAAEKIFSYGGTSLSGSAAGIRYTRIKYNSSSFSNEADASNFMATITIFGE